MKRNESAAAATLVPSVRPRFRSTAKMDICLGGDALQGWMDHSPSPPDRENKPLSYGDRRGVVFSLWGWREEFPPRSIEVSNKTFEFNGPRLVYPVERNSTKWFEARNLQVLHYFFFSYTSPASGS